MDTKKLFYIPIILLIVALALVIFDLVSVHKVDSSLQWILNSDPSDWGVKASTRSVLTMQPGFYSKKKQMTIKYLRAVYPTTDFSELNANDVAKVYNSLWFWYNCAAAWGSSTTKIDDWVTCWKALPGCGEVNPKLPYPPQGWLYSWNDWIGTDGKSGQQISWDKTKLKDQISFSNSSGDVADYTGSVPGQTYWNWHNGPNPIWMYQRAIFRYCYNPRFGADIVDKDGKKYATPGLTIGDISTSDLDVDWNIPRNWWTGVQAGGYLEVTMASEPGLAPSPPICWFDGWRGSGTWINVGKTLVARNKFDAVFKMAEECMNTQEGREFLSTQYRASNAYEVCKNLIYSPCRTKGPIVYDGRKNSPTYKNPVQFNFCNSNSYNSGSVVRRGDDYPQMNMNDALYYWIPDWYTWCDVNEGKTIPDSCIDKIKDGLLYTADRMSAIMTPDEVIFALGIFLGYDSIQMTHSSNGNGRYQYEYCELRFYPNKTKQRDYSDFMMVVPGKPDYVDYRSDFLLEYMPKLAQLFSIRNLFDPTDDSKARSISFDEQWRDSLKDVGRSGLDDSNVPIPKGELKSKWEYNITFKNHISAMFSQLSIAFSPNTNYCADGLPYA